MSIDEFKKLQYELEQLKAQFTADTRNINEVQDLLIKERTKVINLEAENKKLKSKIKDLENDLEYSMQNYN